MKSLVITYAKNGEVKVGIATEHQSLKLPISLEDVARPDGLVSFTYGKADVTAKAK